MKRQNKFLYSIFSTLLSLFLIAGMCSCEPPTNGAPEVTLLPAVEANITEFEGTWKCTTISGTTYEYEITSKSITDFTMNCEYNVVSNETIKSTDNDPYTLVIVQSKTTKTFFAIGLKKDGNSICICCPLDLNSLFNSIDEVKNYYSNFNFEESGSIIYEKKGSLFLLPTVELQIPEILGTWENNDYGHHSEYVVTSSTINDVSMECEYNIVSSDTLTTTDGYTLVITQVKKGTDYTPKGQFYAVGLKLTSEGDLEICCPLDYSACYESIQEIKDNYTNFKFDGSGNYTTTCTKKIPDLLTPVEANLQEFIGTWENNDWGYTSTYNITSKSIKDVSMGCEYNIVYKKTLTTTDGYTLVITQVKKGTDYTPKGQFYVIGLKKNSNGEVLICCPLDYNSRFESIQEVKHNYTNFKFDGSGNYTTTCTRALLPAVEANITNFVGTWKNNDEDEYVITSSTIKDVKMNREFNIVSSETITTKDGYTLVITQVKKGPKTTPKGQFYAVGLKSFITDNLEIYCPLDFNSRFNSIQEVKEKYTDIFISDAGNFGSTCSKVKS